MLLCSRERIGSRVVCLLRMQSSLRSDVLPLTFISFSLPFTCQPRRQTIGCTDAQKRVHLHATLKAAALHENRQRIVDTLRKDLPAQYNQPFHLDYSIYDRGIRFTDPLTKLPPSRLLYKGMLVTIAVIVRLLFKHNSVRFDLQEIEFQGPDAECPHGKIRTKFRTVGRTRWQNTKAAPFIISGEDRFWLGECKRGREHELRIIYHESLWDQSPGDIGKAFLRR